MKKFSVHLLIFIKRDLGGDYVYSSNNVPQPCFHKRYFLSLGCCLPNICILISMEVLLTGQVLMEQAVRQPASDRGSENCHSALRKSLCSVYLGIVTLIWQSLPGLWFLNITDLSKQETRRWFSNNASMHSCFYPKIYLWTDLLFLKYNNPFSFKWKGIVISVR